MIKPVLFYKSQSPNGSTHCPQGHAVEVCRNILLPIADTYDERIIVIVDTMPQWLCELLWLLQAHKAGLWAAWKNADYQAYFDWVGKHGIFSGDVEFTRKGVWVCDDWWALYHTDIYGNNLPEISK